MNVVFADTCFWIALVNPNDQYYAQAQQASLLYRQSKILTTESVIVEFFNFYSEYGKFIRQKTHEFYRQMLVLAQVEIIAQTSQRLEQAIDFHANRPDKGYSLTDCISMTVMRERDCSDVMTNDKHFGQEGFTMLMQR
jgi:uncharacterized protein